MNRTALVTLLAIAIASVACTGTASPFVTSALPDRLRSAVPSCSKAAEFAASDFEPANPFEGRADSSGSLTVPRRAAGTFPDGATRRYDRGCAITYEGAKIVTSNGVSEFGDRPAAEASFREAEKLYRDAGYSVGSPRTSGCGQATCLTVEETLYETAREPLRELQRMADDAFSATYSGAPTDGAAGECYDREWIVYWRRAAIIGRVVVSDRAPECSYVPAEPYILPKPLPAFDGDALAASLALFLSRSWPPDVGQ